MTTRVRVVTDSTACLPAQLIARHDVEVVPLRVTLGSRTAIDGVDVTAGEVAAALRAKVPVSTSRPSPAEFAAAHLDNRDADDVDDVVRRRPAVPGLDEFL